MPEENICYYENDDMNVCLWHSKYDDVYRVMAESWDESLDVTEEFSKLSKAARLYEFIVENYASGPPGDELGEFIHGLLEDGRYN